MPAGLVLTALTQANILAAYPAQSQAITPIVLGLSLVAAGILVAMRVQRIYATSTATSMAASIATSMAPAARESQPEPQAVRGNRGPLAGDDSAHDTSAAPPQTTPRTISG